MKKNIYILLSFFLICMIFVHTVCLSAAAAMPAEQTADCFAENINTTISPAAAQQTADSFVDTGDHRMISESSLTWTNVNGKIRLRLDDGKYQTGFKRVEGKLYCFDAKGNLKTGFFTMGGKTWFASSVQGAMGKGQILTGIVYVNGYYYYLQPSSKPWPGVVYHGFCTINGLKYYFDENGHQARGWITVSGNKYYASCNKNKNLGALLTGKQKIGSKTYLFDSTGRLVKTVADETKRDPYNLKPICQHPALPTGCEMTSLAMVLNFLDVPAEKTDLADNYLTKGPIHQVSPWNAFVGNPRSSNAYGCYAPVVVKAANSYLKAKKSSLRATYISGKELETLSAYTSAGYPVLVWNTMECRKPYYSATWYVNGKKIRWIAPQHCLVLLGFKGNNVVVADPTYGTIRSFGKELFRRGYDAFFKQAVVIK